MPKPKFTRVVTYAAQKVLDRTTMWHLEEQIRGLPDDDKPDDAVLEEHEIKCPRDYRVVIRVINKLNLGKRVQAYFYKGDALLQQLNHFKYIEGNLLCLEDGNVHLHLRFDV